MTDPESLTLSSIAWRDAVVRKLLERSEPGRASAAALSDIDSMAAIVVLAGAGEFLFLVAWPTQAQADAALVNQRVASLVASTQGRVKAHLVIVGGGEPARRFCEEGAHRTATRGRIVVHHLSEQGTVWNGGAALAPLDGAVASVREELAAGHPPRVLTPGELAAARDAFRRLAAAEQAAAQVMTRGRTPATMALVAVLVAIFILEVLWGGLSSGGAAHAGTLYRMGAADHAALLNGEWWRLLSPAFLHGSLLHIAVNGYSLWILGMMTERVFGSARFVVIYGISAAAGAIASSLLSETLSVGASGALFGLLGGQLALALRPRGVIPVNLAGRLRRALLMTILLNVGLSALPSIDWRAHLGGAVAGFLFVLSGLPMRGLPRVEVRTPEGVRSRGWTALALVVILTMAAALGAAFGSGRPWDHGVGPIERVAIPGTTFTLEVPKRLPLTKQSQADSNRHEAVFGWPDRAEIVVDAMVVDEPELRGITEEEAWQALDESADEFRKSDMNTTRPFRIERTPEGPVASFAGTGNGWVQESWLAIRDGSWVRIDVLYQETASPVWRELAPRFIASLKSEPAAP